MSNSNACFEGEIRLIRNNPPANNSGSGSESDEDHSASENGSHEDNSGSGSESDEDHSASENGSHEDNGISSFLNRCWFLPTLLFRVCRADQCWSC